MEVSKHAYNRIYERVHPVCSMKEARKLAKEAYEKGYTLEQLKPEYKHLAQFKKEIELRIVFVCLIIIP